MRQVISRTKFNVAFGAAVGWFDFAGEGNSVTEDIPPPDTEAHMIPVPVAGTFRNLSVIAQSSHLQTTVALEVNGVVSALTVTLPVASTYVSDTTHSVSVVAGDLVQLKYTASASQGAGSDMSFAIEFEGAQQWYGVRKNVDDLANGGSMSAGGLGNGIFTKTGAGSGTDVNTYSLNAVAGTITGLYLHSFTGAPASGNITAYIKKNTITQDGTGGTVATGAELASGSGDDFATSTFTLPISVADHVEIQCRRSGETADFELAASLLFTPTDASQPFMMVGGSNHVPNPFMWNQSNQSASEAEATSTSGPVRITITGIAVEDAQTAGEVTTVTLLDDSVATAATVTFTGPTTLGVVSGLSVPILADSALVLDVDTDSSANVYWGLAAIFGAGPDPPDATTTAIRRVRRFPLPNDELVRLTLNRLQLYAQVGVGTVSLDPVIMVRVSPDGGATWHHERQMTVGPLGAYSKRAFLNRFGQGRDWIVEFTTTDAAFVAWLDCFAEMAQGTS